MKYSLLLAFALLSLMFLLSRAGGRSITSNNSTGETAQIPGDLSSIISESTFNNILKHRGDAKCRGMFYTYKAFLVAAESFRTFGMTGNKEVRKREIAAFFAQTSAETTGGWSNAPDGPFSWGYCIIEQLGDQGSYCEASPQWPCAPGKSYHGRGPILVTWNYNYGEAGKALRIDLTNKPELVSSDPVIAFKTALWFWMTPQAPKPSSHDVISGKWKPSAADKAANRLPGFGTITNIIDGGLECGKGVNDKAQNRVGFYKRYCTILGVTLEDNLDCADQTPF